MDVGPLAALLGAGLGLVLLAAFRLGLRKLGPRRGTPEEEAAARRAYARYGRHLRRSAPGRR